MESEGRETFLRQNCSDLGTNWIQGFGGDGEGWMGDEKPIREEVKTRTLVLVTLSLRCLGNIFL